MNAELGRTLKLAGSLGNYLDAYRPLVVDAASRRAFERMENAVIDALRTAIDELEPKSRMAMSEREVAQYQGDG